MDAYWIDTYKLLQTAKGAFRGIIRRKLRSSLSILGVICGVVALMAMIAIGEGAKKEAIRRIEQLGTKNIYVRHLRQTEEQLQEAEEMHSCGLTNDDAVALQRGCNNVVRTCSLTELAASVLGTKHPISAQIVSCSSDYASIHGLTLVKGRFITAMDSKAKSLVCVLGDGVARQLGFEMDIGNYIQLRDQLFRVVGRLTRQVNPERKDSSIVAFRNSNRLIYIPAGVDISIRDLVPSPVTSIGNRVSEITLEIDSTSNVMNASRQIRRILEVRHRGVRDYDIVVPLELLRQTVQTKRLFQIILGTLAGVALLVGGIGIMNIMLATVSERRKEVGIRRSLGATPGDILFQFLLEAMILTSIGGGIGGLVGVGSVWLVESWADWPVALTPISLSLPFVMAILIGLVFGSYPAYSAAKLSPAEALRYD